MRVAFLISRQPRRITPQTVWVRIVWEASKWCVERGWSLVSGIGLPWIDFTAWAFREHGGEVELVGAGAKKSHWEARDRAIIDRADILVPIAVRRRGSMERLLADVSGKKVMVPRAAIRTGEVAPSISGETVEIPFAIPPRRSVRLPHARVVGSDAGFLWHYTRAQYGPWPGESRDEYFRSLIQNVAGADHDGAAALARILSEQRIRACGRLIRGKFPVVCFTEKPPDNMLALARYRPALVRWDFEPYAVGIPKAAASERGVRRVRYLAAAEYGDLAPEERHLFQKHQPPAVDFTHEAEWRALGDIDLAGLDLAIFHGLP